MALIPTAEREQLLQTTLIRATCLRTSGNNPLFLGSTTVYSKGIKVYQYISNTHVQTAGALQLLLSRKFHSDFRIVCTPLKVFPQLTPSQNEKKNLKQSFAFAFLLSECWKKHYGQVVKLHFISLLQHGTTE